VTIASFSFSVARHLIDESEATGKTGARDLQSAPTVPVLVGQSAGVHSCGGAPGHGDHLVALCPSITVDVHLLNGLSTKNKDRRYPISRVPCDDPACLIYTATDVGTALGIVGFRQDSRRVDDAVLYQTGRQYRRLYR
jgi:hypothetical protein